MKTYDCLIAGAGPIGLALALALRQHRIPYCLCGTLPQDRPNSPDLRTAALFSGSIRLLDRLGVWPALRERAAPLAGIRIVDDTGGLLRAPEQLFAARDLGLDHIGYNIANPDLVRALLNALQPGMRGQADDEDAASHDIGATITDIRIDDDAVTVTLSDGRQRRARLLIAADGRRSGAREAAGIAVRTWSHDQAAITAHLTHSLPHDNISTEIHTRDGPCTVVPFGDGRSSLVWMMAPAAAEALAASDDETFRAALEDRLQGVIGTVTSLTPRRIFALSSLIAQRFAANRTALVGEAGHAFPPIGAQGLNLGLRDAAALLDHIVDARDRGADPGSERILAGYSDARQADVTARTYGVDAMNASLTSTATGLLRGALLHATSLSPALRRTLLTQGMGPIGAWPRLMQP
jgi:2-octaprenyl-6-methoxyphenol hydroxylase